MIDQHIKDTMFQFGSASADREFGMFIMSIVYGTLLVCYIYSQIKTRKTERVRYTRRLFNGR